MCTLQQHFTPATASLQQQLLMKLVMGLPLCVDVNLEMQSRDQNFDLKSSFVNKFKIIVFKISGSKEVCTLCWFNMLQNTLSSKFTSDC